MPRQAKIQKTSEGQDVSAEEDETQKEASTSDAQMMDQDVDDLIGDLVKEELQLVVTRLLRKGGPSFTDDMKREVTKVIKARAKQASLPLSKQLKVMQDLLQAQASNASGVNLVQLLGLAANPSMDMSQATQAFGLSQLPHAGQGQGFGGFEMGGFMPGMDVNAIRRKIRDAFIKTGTSRKRGRFGEDEVKDTYRLDTNTIRAELEKASSYVLQKNEARSGLTNMEAISSEFVNRLRELGEQYVTGFDEVLKKIAKEWVDIFLHDDLAIDQNERDEWFDKLRQWDSSANEEEGVFASARYAAKLGWENTHLKNVLAGEAIGKFKEPKDLSIARLGQLERQERFEEGLNLAKAVDLAFYIATFLLKMNRLAEAEQYAKNVEDSEKLFSIAKVAKPLDVTIAFNLMIKSVSLHPEWSSDCQERSGWLCDLAIASKITDKLVTEVAAHIKSKTIQMEIAKILYRKEQLKAAVDLGKIVLKAYDPLPIPEPKVDATTTTTTTTTFTPPTPVAPTVVVDPGRYVPNNTATWIWDIVYEMLLLELTNEDDMKQTLDYILNEVEDVNQLTTLMNNANTKYEYDQVIVIGTKLYDRIDQIQQKEKALQDELIAQMNELSHNPDLSGTPGLVQQAIQQAQAQIVQRVTLLNQLSQTYVNQGFPSLSLSFNHTWDTLRTQVANTMVNAALESRNPVLQVTPPSIILPKRPQPILRKPKPFELTKLEQVVDFTLSKMLLIDHVNGFCRSLFNKQEYKLGLSVVAKAHDRIKALKKLRIERDVFNQEITLIRNEVTELVNARKPVRPDMKRKLKELDLKERYYALRPPQDIYSLDQDNEYHYNLGSTAISSALQSKTHTDPEKQLSKETIEDTVTQTISILERPNDFYRLATLFRGQNEHEFVLRATKRGITLVTYMEKERENRERIRVPWQLLLQEQQVYINNKQPTPAFLTAEIQKLQQELEKLGNAPAHDSNNVDDYNNLFLQFANLAITTGFAGSLPVVQAVPQSFGFGVSRLLAAAAQPQVIAPPLFSEERLKEIVVEYLHYVQSPQGLIELAGIAQRNQNIELLQFIVETSQDRIAYLAKEFEKREQPRIELTYLKQEKADLEEQKKPFKPEQLQVLKQLELSIALDRTLLPSYYFANLTTLDLEQKKITTLMLNTLLQKKRTLNDQLQRILDAEAMLGEVQKMDTDDDENTKEKVAARIEYVIQKIAYTVDRGLKYVINPKEMIGIASSLLASQEFDLVVKIGKAVQARIIALADQRKEREKTLSELDDLEEEQRQLEEQQKVTKKKAKLDAEKQAKMTDLRKKRDYFNIFPKFTSMSDEDMEDVNLNNAKVLLDNALQKKDLIEMDEKLLPTEKQTQLHAQDKAINEIVEVCLQYVKNPQHITVLMEQMGRSNDIELMLKLGKKCLESVVKCEKDRVEFEVPQQVVAILEKEQEQLNLLRKSLEPALKEKLDKANAAVKDTELPAYVTGSSQDDFATWKHKALSKMLTAVLNLKTKLENRITTDQTLTTEIIEAESKKNSAYIDQVVSLIIKQDIGNENPSNLNAFISELSNKKEYKFAIQVAERTFEVIRKLRQAYDEKQLPEQIFVLLEKENDQLLSQRKQLPNDKQEQLRELKLKTNLANLKPRYFANAHETNDNIALAVARSIINAALELKKETEDKMEMDSQVDEKDASKHASDAFDYVKKVTSLCLDNVLIIENNVKLAQDASSKLEYDLTLLIGKVCQQRVQDLHAKIKKIKELDEEKQQLLTKLKLPTRTLEQAMRLQEIEIELARLPLKYQSEAAIDAFMFHIGKLMMNAAKVVEDHVVLRQQAEIVFKININLENFGEVKVLTPENEWDKVRKTLLDYSIGKIREKTEAMKEGKMDDESGETHVDLDLEPMSDDVAPADDMDEDDEEEDYGRRKRKTPKKAAKKGGRRKASGISVKRSTLREMIELLLSEGLWKECVEAFPAPEYGNVALLEKLWLDVEANDKKNLKNLLGLVESYVTKDFLNYEFNNTSSLLDMAGAHFADWEAKVYKTVSEKMLLNIVQKQYQSFVEFLKFIKKRLTDKGLNDEWDDFFAAVKKAHKAKKKLMGIIEVADI